MVLKGYSLNGYVYSNLILKKYEVGAVIIGFGIGYSLEWNNNRNLRYN